jgi:Protein of unknown function (DUF3108)
MDTVIQSTLLRRASRALLTGAMALAGIGGFAGVASAQSFTAHDRGAASSTGDSAVSGSGYRVSVGERATYDVEYKGRGVGSGSLEVLGSESTNGFSTYHAALRLQAGFLFAKVNEQFDSWFDPNRYFSRHFSQNQRELTHSRKRNYEIAPEKHSFRETETGATDTLSTNEPLDDISFLYYVRTLPLKIGDVDTIPRYFKSGRDVIVKVVRRETVTVPAGTFNTIVVQPTITNAGGLFGQGGKAEVYLSDDAQRTVVMLKSSVPVLGSVALTLREVKAGVP